jgi:sRNA-binding protein
MTRTEDEHKRRVAEAERRVAEANRRVANCSAAERRAEEVANAERRANASVATRAIATRPSHPKPVTAPAPTPAQRHTPKEIPVMTANQKILFQSVATTTARLASARQSLEDARNLARAGFASDVVFALHVEAGAFHAWLKASEAFQACRD